LALVARQIHWLGRTCFTAEQMSPTLAGVLEEEEPPPADQVAVPTPIGGLGDWVAPVVGLGGGGDDDSGGGDDDGGGGGEQCTCS